MEKELNLSWNYTPIVKEVVIDELFNLPEYKYSENQGYQMITVNTNGKNFDRYDFVIVEVAFIGSTTEVSKFDGKSGAFLTINYGQDDSDGIAKTYTISDKCKFTASGSDIIWSTKTIFDNPPSVWDAEIEGKPKSDYIRLNANWAGSYHYTVEGSSPQLASHGFTGSISWYNGKVNAVTYNEYLGDHVMIRLKITGYIGYIHS